MNFCDEPFVKLYKNDTITWKLLGWEGRCVLVMLLRKVDRAGCLDLTEAGTEGLCALIDLPEEVTDAGLKACIRRGCATVNGSLLHLPRFQEAQKARQSDRARARASRERRAVEASQPAVNSSRNVTKESHSVTDDAVPSEVVTQRIEENRRDQRRSEACPPTEKDPNDRRAREPGEGGGSPGTAPEARSPSAAAAPERVDPTPKTLPEAWKALCKACPALRPSKDWGSPTGLNPNEEGALARQWIDAEKAGYTLDSIVRLAPWVKAGFISMRSSPREYLCRSLCTALVDADKWRSEGSPERSAQRTGSKRIGTTSATAEVKTLTGEEIRRAAE